MKKILFSIYCLLFIFASSLAQVKITTAASGNTGYAGDIWIGPGSTITFVVQNTNNHDILLTEIEDFKSTAGPGFPLSPAGFHLWYSTTSLSGDPGSIASSPDWTKLTGDTATVVNMVPGYNTIFSNLNFLIPANATYRFALQSTTGIAYSGFSTPSVLTKDSVNLVLGSAIIGGSVVGYAGNYPNSSYSNSWFTGSITFQSAVPCNSAPIAGSTVSSVSDICSGIQFQLDLTGYSSGLGQTYQWQSSLNGTTWNNIAGAIGSSATLTQSLSSFYRCAITCSGNTAFSAPVQVTTPLGVSGNYTINSTLPTNGNNFQTFNDAINYVKCGINGPVVFTVAPNSGPYVEQISIPFIGGTSSTNTITFKGKNETISMIAGTTSNLPIITLDNADHIIIDSLILDCSASPYGWGILLTNQADSNVIKNCTIINEYASNSMFAHNGILINGSNQVLSTGGNNGNYNLITNNTIIGGTYGVFIWGAGINNNQNVGNKVIGNKIQDFYSYGVSVNYAPQNTIISGNEFFRFNRSITTSPCGAININTGCSSTLVEKNRVHNLFDAISSSTATVYAINISASAILGQENRVINNLVYSLNGNTNNYGIYNSSASNMQAYHNTIVFDDVSSSTGASYGLAQSGTAIGVDFKNNIVYITRGGAGNQRCINYSANSSIINSNHNVLYINCPGNAAAVIGLFGNTSYITLADWKQANNAAYDQQSVSANPLFSTSPNDFIPTSGQVNDIGGDLGVTEDILNVSRSNFPDPGAYEFTSAPCNSSIVSGATLASVSNICPDKLFSLQLNGNSFGAGQLYQWQSSANNINWTNVGNATPNPSFVTSQLSSNYYRCAVSCGGGSPVYSTSIQVITPGYLSGTFTINKNLPTGSGNYQTFTDALNAVQCGINGPVVFNVVPGSGPYSEHFTIPQITGTSAINTLTFNGNGETLRYSSTDINNKAAIILNGADHIILDSINIDISTSTYSWGIVLTNQADSNVIRNCTINCNASITSLNAIGIYMNGSTTTLSTQGNNGSFNVIKNNTINAGYYGIYLYGNSSSSTQNINNLIEENIIKDFYNYGVYAQYQPSGLVIRGNDFSRPTRTSVTSGAGVYIYTGAFGALVEKNRVHNLFGAIKTSTQTSYGIFIGSDPTATNPNKVINNLIYDMNGNGVTYGIMCSFGNNVKVYHNTIVLDDKTATAGNTFGFHQPVQATGMEFKNNLIYIGRNGSGTKTCLSIGNSSSVFNSNNNVFYIDSSVTGNIATLQGTNYSTLASWKLAAGSIYDQASVNANPKFVNASGYNYKPNADSVDNIGTPVGVLTDFDGSVRSAVTPDAGAYEFSPVLSVSGLTLKGYRSSNSNILQWNTLTENNCLGYEVLRSTNTNSNEFIKVGFVSTKAVNGNSSTVLSYRFEDVTNNINNYYKLKQLDKDGKYTYSNIVSIKSNKTLILDIISVYPNPVDNKLNISISSPTYTKATILITDIYGKAVVEKAIEINVGENNTYINLSKIAAGNYTIKVVCNNGCETTVKKFIKK